MNCRVAEHVFGVFNLLQEENRKAKDYGNGISLGNSEMAFLDVVYRQPDANVSRISSLLGLTKGAVTQAYQRLGQKGLIQQYMRPGNKKEKHFRLTSLGEEARMGYQRFHEQANQRLCSHLGTLTEEEVKVIFDFLGVLKQCVPFCEFPCKCSTQDMEDDYEQDIATCLRAARSAGNRG